MKPVLGWEGEELGPWLRKKKVFEFSWDGFIMACVLNIEIIFSTSIKTGFFIVSWVLSYSLSTKPLMFLSTWKRHLEVLRCISINVPNSFFLFLENISDRYGSFIHIWIPVRFQEMKRLLFYYDRIRALRRVVFLWYKLVLRSEFHLKNSMK
jgi:hypothetical protein